MQAAVSIPRQGESTVGQIPPRFEPAAGTFAFPGAATSVQALQCRRGFEAHRLARLHLDRLPGAWIARSSCLTLCNRECAEARHFESAFALQLGYDSGNDIAGGGIRKSTGQTSRVLQD